MLLALLKEPQSFYLRSIKSSFYRTLSLMLGLLSCHNKSTACMSADSLSLALVQLKSGRQRQCIRIPLQEALAEPPNDQIFLAGEAVSSKYMGHGACSVYDWSSSCQQGD